MRKLLKISAVIVGIGVIVSIVSSHIYPKKKFNNDNLGDYLDEKDFDDALDKIIDEYFG